MNASTGEKFTGKADVYSKYRASYPQDLLDFLYTEIGFTKSSTVADIGSGTGIFSRLLLEKGSRVYGVELNADMRQAAEQELHGYSNFTSVNASAENTPLPPTSVDYITAAQAFHWFDKALFKQECKRILKENGKVALIWNTRDYDNELVKKDYAIRKKYCIDTKGLGGNGGPPADIFTFFAGEVATYKSFENNLLLTREAFLGMNLSRSYSPRKEQEPEKHAGFVKELGELFEEYAVEGAIAYPHSTQCYIGAV